MGKTILKFILKILLYFWEHPEIVAAIEEVKPPV